MLRRHSVAAAVVSCLLSLNQVALADDAAPEPPPGSESELRISPTDGVVVEDGGSKLILNMAVWLRYEALVPPEDDVSAQFRVPLARTQLRAFLLDGHLQGLIQPEFAGSNARLLDAHVDWQFGPEASIRAGQFRTPYSRAYLTPIVALQLPGRGFVSDTFRLDRDTGLMLYGNPFDGKLEYNLAVVNGAPVNNPTGDDQYPSPIARVVYNFGKPVPYDQSPAAAQSSVDTGFAIGAAGAYQRRLVEDPADVNADIAEESWHASTELAFVSGPVSASAEGFLRFTRPAGGSYSRAQAGFVQGSVIVIPKTLELAARASYVDPADDASDDTLQIYEGGINTFFPWGEESIGHHFKLMLRYGLERSEQPFSASAGDGTQHRATALLQWWM